MSDNPQHHSEIARLTAERDEAISDLDAANRRHEAMKAAGRSMSAQSESYRLRAVKAEASLDADPVQSQAAVDVLAERQRQISAEGWTPEHDDAHSNGEMAKAGVCYAWIAAQSVGVREAFTSPPPTWPDDWAASWWKPTTPRLDLVKAGALILAEIERLDRAALKGGAE